MWTKTDFSQYDYSREMDRLNTQYNDLTLAAARCRRDNGGKMTVKEAEYYDQAVKTCEQIMHMNMSERSVHTKWKGRRDECLRMIDEIADVLAPKPPQPPKPPVIVDPPVGGDKGEGGKVDGSTKTASGFVTKNACEDVSAETIEKWYKTKPTKNFDEITGMEDLKERLMKETAQLGWVRVDSQLKIPPVQCYFFYGPPGTGKTSIIHAFAHEMMKKNENFKFIQLMGGDIHASLVGVAEKTVKIAFQEAVDNEPCLVFIDEIENVCVDRQKNGIQGHEARLTVAFLEALNVLRDSKTRVVFMGATNHPGLVDVAMMDRVKLIKVPLPDEPARAKYFTRTFENLILGDDITIDDMVCRTDNYSYRDLDRLTESVALKMKDAVIADYQILDADGNLDQEASDKAASEALQAGKVLLTWAMFEAAQKENVPSDKSRIREELRAFEERTGRME